MSNLKLSALCLALPFVASAKSMIETVVVTPNNMEQSLNDVIATTHVLYRDDIERIAPRDVQELLNRLPSVTAFSQGGKGKLSSYFIRGLASNQNLVMIDGVNIRSIDSGAARLEFIPIDTIERIEIVKGSVASIYGSAAMGGVINIITNSSNDRQSVSIEAGSNNSYAGSYSLVEVKDNVTTQLNVGHREEEGFSSIKYQADLNQDDDGYQETFLNFSQKLNISDVFDFTYGVKFNEGFNEYDNVANYWNSNNSTIFSNKFDQRQFFAHANTQITNSTSLVVQFDRIESEYVNFYSTDTDVFSRNKTHSNQGRFSLNSKLNDKTFIGYGLRIDDQKINSSASYLEDSRLSANTYFNLQSNVNTLGIVMGIAQHYDDQFGEAFTYNMATSFHLNELQQISFSHGTAYRAPQFMLLYGSGSNSNPDLLPEESQSWEISFNHASLFNMSFYKTNVNNMITSDASTKWIGQNIAEARVEGVDIFGSVNVSKTVLFDYAFNFQDARDNLSGSKLVRRPNSQATLGLTKFINEHSIQFTLNSQDHVLDGKDADNNDIVLGGFTTVDISSRFALSDQISLDLSVKNIFDKDYEFVNNYNTGGRFVNTRLTYNFD